MASNAPALRASILLLATVTVGGCSGDRVGTFELPSFGSSGPASPIQAPPSAPPVNMSGRWLFSSPGRGQCNMTFGMAAQGSAEGTIAPEGGCPGKFFTSRKWTYDAMGLMIRDHNSEPLAQLTSAGGGFNGQSTAGESVALTR